MPEICVVYYQSNQSCNTPKASFNKKVYRSHFNIKYFFFMNILLICIMYVYKYIYVGIWVAREIRHSIIKYFQKMRPFKGRDFAEQMVVLKWLINSFPSFRG